jgi:type VI secretion system protein ImpE
MTIQSSSVEFYVGTTALSQLREGDLHRTLDIVKQDVRKAPRDPRLRTFLFQLFSITGEWERALTQLAAVARLDANAEPMAETYSVVIRCEVLREGVFRGERTPTVLGEPGDWLPLLIEATRLLAYGRATDAARLRDAAFEAAPETPGTLNDAEFAWIADADPRLGPVLEAFVGGSYAWVPFHRIRALRLEPAQDLRDAVWMPARFTWSKGGEAVGFVPTRYPGSAAAPDPALSLARRTEWIPHSEDWSLPLGQRMFVTDREDGVALLDLRRLLLAPASAAGSA